MANILIVIDMQNDFIDGALKNPAAQKIVPGIVELINGWDGPVYLTQDTHTFNYLKTQEGQKLPIVHCVHGTPGWLINSEILTAAGSKDVMEVFEKPTFGAWSMTAEMGGSYRDITHNTFTLVGTCTDICVISNAMLLKSRFIHSRIIVRADLCAGTTEENHNRALEAMKMCQIDVVYGDAE